MKASLKWLKELVDFDLSTEQLSIRLTDAGLEVDTITHLGGDLDKVVVGEIEQVSAHPRAEGLSVCAVRIGSEVLQMVCGAPNVTLRAKVPVALIGATLPGGVRIAKSTLKGVDSYGMICSEKELGIGEEEQGIMILDPGLKVGSPLASALDLEDHILDIDITANRPDALSMMGIAREVAALCGTRVKKREPNLHEIEKEARNMVQVEIGDPQACPRYAARVIEEVKIAESPFWLKRRVQSAGMRPINNVVDITNLVMLELGHPLHAFDYELFRQKKVVVRRARDKEKFVTLDQVERTLSSEVLLITDGAKPVAIAGIMGGLESEVTSYTRNVLLESAYFDPRVTRRGRMSLGISTESSQRFERGADPNGVRNAVDRAAELLEALAGGKVLKGVVDNYPCPIHPVRIALRPSRVNQILDANLEPRRIESILTSLEFSVQQKDGFEVTVPTFRPDVTREIDLIEEIARIHGYANIKTTLRAGGALVTEIHPEDEIARRIKELMAGKGFFEVITNNLVDPEILIKLNPDVPWVTLRNPLSQDLSVLSTTLACGLLAVVSRNKNRLEKNLRLFELAKVFIPRNGHLPEERLHLGIAISGTRMPRNWDVPEVEADLYDLKGAVEGLLSHFSLSLEMTLTSSNALLKEGSGFSVQTEGKEIGLLGEVSREILDLFGIRDTVFWAELDFEKLWARLSGARQFSPLPQYPPVDRDVAVVVDEELLSREILGKIRETGGGMVEEVALFDVYRGKQVPVGKKSLAWSIRYRSRERTLTDEEVEGIHQRVISELESCFGATLRK
ncbi:MAG: phenylalanine--tRNA ligase subunit beta [Candidatus Zixiibacteriota bacterium]